MFLGVIDIVLPWDKARQIGSVGYVMKKEKRNPVLFCVFFLTEAQSWLVMQAVEQMHLKLMSCPTKKIQQSHKFSNTTHLLAELSCTWNKQVIVYKPNAVKTETVI